jgi:hypothetical protein
MLFMLTIMVMRMMIRYLEKGIMSQRRHTAVSKVLQWQQTFVGRCPMYSDFGVCVRGTDVMTAEK